MAFVPVEFFLKATFGFFLGNHVETRFGKQKAAHKRTLTKMPKPGISVFLSWQPRRNAFRKTESGV
ncbi:hypothetical protein AYR62_08950 [Secundilactobacillus paracollinoides]|uniref:Uncharacterized protein n=1 Tax=Secundilactobacillus paracollinoides TaxID=240427 RepID=A0A1B2IZ59_9LACO|nr:hypothetical protein AYR61_08670 [Secundilactobacillus paracollinoides]ANZ64187.1 hypothetical protein AYR62_08950 [Secundilactobacillus paracollinoides]ANZ67341.1 hypothetical protein AYR63_09415 [Secundilactobacillus paracollinoides]